MDSFERCWPVSLVAKMLNIFTYLTKHMHGIRKHIKSYSAEKAGKYSKAMSNIWIWMLNVLQVLTHQEHIATPHLTSVYFVLNCTHLLNIQCVHIISKRMAILLLRWNIYNIRYTNAIYDQFVRDTMKFYVYCIQKQKRCTTSRHWFWFSFCRIFVWRIGDFRN